jgi:hypothetical protein
MKTTFKEFKKTPNKADIKIGDKFTVNKQFCYVFRRYLTNKDNKNAQFVDGVYLEHMLETPFSYYGPKNRRNNRNC